MFKNLVERFGQTIGLSDSNEDEEPSFFFRDSLPSTFQVTSNTVTNLVQLSASQRLFLTDHASTLRKQEAELDRLRVQIEDGSTASSASVSSGQWSLNSIELSDQDAVDLVRTSPDIMSQLQFELFEPSSGGFLSSFKKFFSFSSTINVRESSIATELGFSLSVEEVAEAFTAVFKTTSQTLSTPPKSGEETFVSRLYELKSSHRGRENSTYLLVEVEMTRRTMARGRDGLALNISTELSIYDSHLFGPELKVVSMNGNDPAGLAQSQMSRAELTDILSSDGTFLAKSNFDVVVDGESGSGASTASERSTAASFHAVKRLVKAANESTAQFSRKVFVQRSQDMKNEIAAEREELEKKRLELERQALEEDESVVAAESATAYSPYYYQGSNSYVREEDPYYEERRRITLPEAEAEAFIRRMN